MGVLFYIPCFKKRSLNFLAVFKQSLNRFFFFPPCRPFAAKKKKESGMMLRVVIVVVVCVCVHCVCEWGGCFFYIPCLKKTFS